jgi:hypothetical protein
VGSIFDEVIELLSISLPVFQPQYAPGVYSAFNRDETSNIPGGNERSGRKAGNLTVICAPIVY